ncbi:MAG: VWA domain-containing protein, partial [Acidimicrobiia bacterium]|nr:VWA domain-containing protein [Acidimicrobiia bacterium]
MRRLPVVVLGLLLVLWPAGVSAQESGMEIVVDASDHPRVVVDVLVPAAIAEREPPGEAFALVENGRLVPAAVLAPAETITEVVLVVDTSGSMDGEPLQTAVAAATGFFDRLPEATVASLITTGGSSEVVSGPGSTAAVADALSGLEADGETALYDGVVDAVALFDADPRTRALLVVLSDGADTASEADAAEAA